MKNTGYKTRGAFVLCLGSGEYFIDRIRCREEVVEKWTGVQVLTRDHLGQRSVDREYLGAQLLEKDLSYRKAQKFVTRLRTLSLIHNS